VFDRFRTDGHRVRHGALWCTWIADPDAVPPRVAFAVGRSVGGAVVRNRLRRRLRAAVGDAARSGALPPGWYLIGASTAALACDAPSLRATLSQLLAKVRAGGSA
jgi:ribonuclease P protein component